ncbi:transcriptional regulator [Clostridium sp. chh4-2]|uniref:helix-turn-helix domain-containing protein n=1 Tax=Clostridium sp. chh4-2 TaxID=2067550 RepID=UPI000CCED0C5|nr:helix-turn-helix transcriptional regulator [Clostridium sp. chh4-2]PNV61464.1 transcriptional regulator [Clostridium sp. chh4-2]
MPINHVIREKRKELGLTQEQVAGYLGVSTPAVNKWEKGSANPDIALLPALARLLNVDLNTLLCFNEGLTKQEIDHFISELSGVIKKHGIETGFKKGIEKVREYPNCPPLIHLTAITLEFALLMSGMHADDKKPYEDEILALYERNAACDDPQMKARSAYMLVSKYMNRGETQKAKELLDQMPEPETPDKRLLEIDLLINQGELDRAEELLERKLLSKTSEMMMLFTKLTDIELKQGNEENASRIAEIFSHTAKQLELWDYTSYVVSLGVAVQQENIPESLSILKSILAAAEKPWETEKTLLYRHINSKAPKDQPVTQASLMLPPLLAELESSPRYGFLQSNAEFQQLIRSYRSKY